MAYQVRYVLLLMAIACMFMFISSRFLFEGRSLRHYQIINEPTKFSSLKEQLPEESHEEEEYELENLPSVYYEEGAKFPKPFNKTCARFPDKLNLQFNNDYWQMLETTNGSFYLLNAYLDVRKNNEGNKTVRILGTINRIEPSVKTYCQIWFDDKTGPALVPSQNYIHIWNLKWGGKRQGLPHPYLISCDVPDEFADLTPTSVSLVEHKCTTATNNLKIHFDQPKKKKDFAVCVKGLNYPYTDISVRMIEWIELLSVLGVDKIFFYKFQVHPNMEKVLAYYKKRNMVHTTPITLSGNAPNTVELQTAFLKKKLIERRIQEVIPYNDCLYKNLYRYKYLILLDIDEIIIPKQGKYIDLLGKIENKTSTSYMVQNVYFLDEYLHQHVYYDGIPHYMHMMQHVRRSKLFTPIGHYVKGFHDTNHILTLHNHFAFKCLQRCRSKNVETQYAQLQHYRGDCVKGVRRCEEMKNDSVVDTTIWNFEQELIPRVEEVMKAVYWESQEKNNCTNCTPTTIQVSL